LEKGALEAPFFFLHGFVRTGNRSPHHAFAFHSDNSVGAKGGRAMVNKDQVKGATKQASGAVKEAAGKATGSASTELKGKAKKTEGKVQKEGGNLKEKLK
jgi:uncharacterized protein YjbJ (UPF0337 family)